MKPGPMLAIGTIKPASAITIAIKVINVATNTKDIFDAPALETLKNVLGHQKHSAD